MKLFIFNDSSQVDVLGFSEYHKNAMLRVRKN